MTKILTGGVGKTEVAKSVSGLGLDGLTVTVSNDMEAAMKLRAGQADYYLGTCHTGAGASLGVLLGLVGASKCHTFGRSVPTAEEISALLAEGKTVFGFAIDQIDAVAPLMARAIAARS
ncbi:DUF2620 domain-containing protein [Streptomyces sp. 8L]|uniref:DUF2620 domain-containing protein n=1 Tax=Streptomyces sp. 8L TaxID=2877242 RepID=UPI001CD4F9B3|nr:DUF2620 domain-containing protein [Streptomyces sp. 8L]MCA1218598.1 DUF2620 domain-containing protein [Streptomyces sp. 8L]